LQNYFIHKFSEENTSSVVRELQQQEDQTNSKDNIPPIEEATERKPYGLRIF
jgi:hypothetical protein